MTKKTPKSYWFIYIRMANTRDRSSHKWHMIRRDSSLDWTARQKNQRRFHRAIEQNNSSSHAARIQSSQSSVSRVNGVVERNAKINIWICFAFSDSNNRSDGMRWQWWFKHRDQLQFRQRRSSDVPNRRWSMEAPRSRFFWRRAM